MKTKTKSALWLTVLLVLCTALAITGCVTTSETTVKPAEENIESIQAYTDMTYYGQGLVSVEITYKDTVDVGDVTPETYILEGRGHVSPEFDRLGITGVEVDGQVITLSIYTDTGATEDNELIYYNGMRRFGPEGAERLREAKGVYGTDYWYRSTDGTIYYGDQDTDEYKANTLGLGYQVRECLELRLRHVGEPPSAAACLANDYGRYNMNGLWKPTIDANFGEGGFISFNEAGIYIPSTAANSPDGTADPYVRGWFYVPDSYDGSEAVPLILTVQGNIASFWLLPDGTNNFGTGIMYDGSGVKWMDSGAIVLNVHDRSGVGSEGVPDYDFVLDNVTVIKYFLDNYNIDRDQIVLNGCSRGTMASNVIIRALAGCQYSPSQNLGNPGAPDRYLDKDVFGFEIGSYICNNGTLLGSFSGPWTETDDYYTIAETGLRIWVNDGEQDFNNIDQFVNLQRVYSEVGYSDEWIEDNLHMSGFPSELFYYWGESDHWVNRNLYYFFYDTIYYGSDMKVVDGEIVYNRRVQPGGTYVLQFRGAQPSNPDYEYTVYPETVRDWVFRGIGEL